jgi:hypothetical protein
MENELINIMETTGSEIGDNWNALATQYDYVQWAGIITAIVVFAFEVWLSVKGYIFSGFKKKIEKAKANGHVIQAKMIEQKRKRTFDKRKNDTRTGYEKVYWYTTKYQYEVNGEKKVYAIATKDCCLPPTISLYYVKNPRRVFSKYDEKGNPLQFLICIIPILAAMLVMKILGYEF